MSHLSLVPEYSKSPELPELNVSQITLAPPYEVTVIHSLEDFDALSPHWDSFLNEAEIANLCLSHHWLKTWLSYFPPEQLLVMVVKDAHGQWVGAAPFQINRSKTGYSHRLLRHVQFIGTQPTVFDWMQIVTHPQADAEAVLQSIATMLNRVAWDVLDLYFNPHLSQLEALCRFLNKKPTADALRETMPIPFLPLVESEADYAKNRRKKTRLEVNRHRNRFAKEYGEEPTLTFHTTEPDSDALLQHFFEGHVQYWKERGIKSEFQRFPELQQFYRKLLEHAAQLPDARAPRLLFSVLRIQEQPLSYHLGFWQGQSYLSHITHYNQAYKSYSPGTLHMDALIFDTLKREGQSFEFGRGDEPYKKLWTKNKKSLWNLRLFRNPWSRAVWQIDITLKKLTGRAVL